MEIRCPERGRKPSIAATGIDNLYVQFGNKMPREGTETDWAFQPKEFRYLEIRYPERGRKRGLRRLLITVFNVG